MKTIIVLLTWQRVHTLANTISMLNNQSYKDFDIHVSNGDVDQATSVDTVTSNLNKKFNLSIKVTHDGNKYSCFRRFFIAKEYAEQGYDVVMFLDDDISIPSDYVKRFIDSYEPKSYQSAYTWTFQDEGKDYYKKRTRVKNNDHDIKYAGAGVSMVDASVFLNKEVMSPPPHAYDIDDLWMSYCCDHILKWKLKYVDVPKLIIGGGDHVALFREIKDREGMNKAKFLRELVDLGWQV